MRIGICDDSLIMRQVICEICHRIMRERDVDAQVIEFQNGEEIFELGKFLDLLILDIEMPGISGIEVKDRFQQMRIDTDIIYVTVHDEMMKCAFGTHVFGFVRKCEMQEQLPTLLRSVIDIADGTVTLEDGTNSRDIAYIMAEHVYCNIFLGDGSTKIMRTSIEGLNHQLKCAGFVHTHRSYIVNLKYVEHITQTDITVLGEKIPISVRRSANVRKSYEAFRKKNAKYFR